MFSHPCAKVSSGFVWDMFPMGCLSQPRCRISLLSFIIDISFVSIAGILYAVIIGQGHVE